MPATIDAPPAAPVPTGVRIIEGPPPPPPPPPTSEIRVTAPAIAPGAEPTTFKKGAAWDRMRQGLQKKADEKQARDYPEAATPPAAPAPAKAPASKPAVTPPAEDATPPEPGSTPTDPASTAAATPAEPGDEVAPKGKEKANPWKLYKAEKEERAKVEQQFQELRKQIVPEQERKALEERATKAEARAKELDDEIRYVRYEKSSEFQEKYHKPYEAAWKRAMSELSEITLTDPQTNQVRPVTAEDMLELVNLPLGKAREVADAVFGKFAGDVMIHRKEIRNLFEQRTAALEEARKNGAEREQQQTAQAQNFFKELDGKIKTEWDKVVDSDLSNPENGQYFKPREGVQEWNDRLEKGIKLVDEAFSGNPRDPRLTPAQRTEIIRKHAAVRNRAAGWGPLKWENSQLKAEIKALKERLSGYVQSAPPPGGATPASAEPVPQTGLQRVFGDLRKIAK